MVFVVSKKIEYRMTKKCWIIVGASSAIATRFAHVVAKTQNQIILLGRDLKKLGDIQNDLRIRYSATVDCIEFDGLQTDAHQRIAQSCMALANNPISLFIAFGMMGDGPAITHTQLQALTVINSNFTGVVSVVYAFLSFLQKQKQGEIVILGSVAGERGRASNFDYGAAKSALAVFCEGLSVALYQNNISVTLMKLGYIDTPMTYNKPGVFLAADPHDCAEACLKAADQKVFTRYFPWFWRWIMFIVKLIPQRVMLKLKF